LTDGDTLPEKTGYTGWQMLGAGNDTGREASRSGERRSGRDRRKNAERRGAARWDPGRKERRSGKDRRGKSTSG
jgi:hypothetical protein